MNKPPAIDLDLLLYLALGLISAMLVSLTSDTAYKYVNNDRLWWYVQWLLWGNIIITHWKAYRSTSHGQRMNDFERSQIAAETEKQPPVPAPVAPPLPL